MKKLQHIIYGIFKRMASAFVDLCVYSVIALDFIAKRAMYFFGSSIILHV